MNDFHIRETTICSSCNKRVMVRQLVNTMAYPTVSMQNSMSGCCGAPVNFIIEPRHMGPTFSTYKTLVDEYELLNLRRQSADSTPIKVEHKDGLWYRSDIQPTRKKARAK